MKKGIDLDAQIQLGDAEETRGATRGSHQAPTIQELQKAFAQANPGLSLTVKRAEPANKSGVARVRVYIEGEQDPAADFEAMASQALRRAGASVAETTRGMASARGSVAAVGVRGVHEVENAEEEEVDVLPPRISEEALGSLRAARATRGPEQIAADVSTLIEVEKPDPPENTFDGCPSAGDGHDTTLNGRKNRLDTADWNLVTISSILALKWPPKIGAKLRSSWSDADKEDIARYEGIPVQVQGWFAGAKKEGPESCNCHSVSDVDYHLWIVDDPGKVHDRTQAVVAEVSPRVRSDHPELSFNDIRPLVDGVTEVRLSGWLLMDQEHPDQVGKTRGTIWEVHPVISIDVLQDGNWSPIGSNGSGAGSVDGNS